jgi:hypothetical protein
MFFCHLSETWSLTLREELRVFENRVLRRIFGVKQEAGKECTMRIFINLYISLNIIRVRK